MRKDSFAVQGDAPFNNLWPVTHEPSVARQKELGWVNGMRWIPRCFPNGQMDYLGGLRAIARLADDRRDPLKSFDVDFWFTAPAFEGIGRQAGLSDIAYICKALDLARAINRKHGRRVVDLHVAGELDSTSLWPYQLPSRRAAAAYWRKWNGALYREAYARKSASGQWAGLNAKALPDLFTFYRITKRDMRRDPLFACCSRAWAVHQYYEWGFGSVVCESNCWTPWNTQLQIAFLRGAARQYNGHWGLDFSPWGGALPFTKENIARGATYGSKGFYSGISASLLLREWLAGFMSGAQRILQEASYHSHYLHDYRGDEAVGVGDFPNTGDDGLAARAAYVKKISPAGKNAGRFADFALRKHPDRGQPYVPFGIMLEHDHGWNSCSFRVTERGEEWSLAGCPDNWPPAIWGRSVKEEPGDHMITNFFRAAYSAWPGFHIKWDEKLPCQKPYYGAWWSKSNREIIRAVRSGELPIENLEQDLYLGSSRWGDSFDVVIENCPPRVLASYKALILLGRIKLTDRLRARLRRYVRGGGILVINVRQVARQDGAWLGVEIGSGTAVGSRSRVLATGRQFLERPFTYTQCVPRQPARMLADDGDGAPLAIERSIGRGRVILTTPHYLQANASLAGEQEAMESRLLNVGIDLINRLHAQTSLVTIEGPPVQSIVSRRAEDIIVTLINNYAKPWSGRLAWDVSRRRGKRRFAVRDCWNETDSAVIRTDKGYACQVKLKPFSAAVLNISPFPKNIHVFRA